MDLTDREIRELALFFAKRMDTSLNLLDPTDPPPRGDPRQAWVEKLTEARDTGYLERLTKRVARVDPDDENLQSACEILVTPGARLESFAIGAAFVGGTGILLVSIAAAAGILAAAAMLDTTERIVEISPAPGEEVFAMADDESVEPEIEESYEEPIITVEPEVAAVQATPTKKRAAKRAAKRAKKRFERCAAKGGEIVGYWYAGESTPGDLGQYVTVSHATNVRADYPDVHNNFDARTNINCVLQEGDVVRLSRKPILVPADRYWIPLLSGDLVSS